MVTVRLWVLLLLAISLVTGGAARAEDGYRLWLRNAPVVHAAQQRPGQVTLSGSESPTALLARDELTRGLSELFPGVGPAGGTAILLRRAGDSAMRDGAFNIISSEQRVTITAASDTGLLYGAFALLRELGQGKTLGAIRLDESPAYTLRMLNHWDNPDGHVERGYAGRSIFDWWHLPGHVDARMTDYARANASIGINGVVINNVNARAMMLEPRYIAKVKALADTFRPWGIRVYVSARFSAPRDIGGLATADPLDPAVRAWWKAKSDEIYTAIPDFGGFLVKANSEGQPGPQDYGRSHADGANMLAEAIGDRGTVIWRAFVYAAENREDRAKQAFTEFQPLDGTFAPNVVVQVKNGPIDFQPREPFHPLFGAMPQTRLSLELEITKEYLGFASHLAFLAPLFEETLDADTGRRGTVARTVSVIAGVANTGSDRNWTGSHFDQANWYAFGRLAWDPRVPSAQIAREWAAQTFSRDPAFLNAVVPMMLGSREAVVDYMTPLGLAHVMGTGHHYGPAPWVSDLARPEWNPVYYHRADRDGIGFDRTATGSDALAHYAPDVAQRLLADEELLLWFRRVSWDHRLSSGRTLWEELPRRYDRGVATVERMRVTWASLAPHVDAQRHRAVADFLGIQADEARWWRDASLAYWSAMAQRPLPAGHAAPQHPLSWYQARSVPEAPGE
ncbi:alpha-glucuronidase [Sphingomonas sp.]|uniref:alpha-glucuronidase n=1 Tax=Sphingomonas sp. TaxID=28214 RepID=UPI001793B424|nr:alpha-glucuronidase [Sphingomonas sp.]MBA4760179.1 alpha-glucuronidase [Sphingomonas sp.]